MDRPSPLLPDQTPGAGGRPGADPPDGEGFDEEPVRQVPGSFLSALPQFFVFPFILVATLAAAWMGLRLLVGSETSDAPTLIAEVRAAGGPHARWQALHALADGLRRQRLDLDEVDTQQLLALYRDYAGESEQMRQFLLQILQWKRAPELTAVALAALDEDESAEGGVRLAALFALAQMADPVSVPRLAAALSQGSDEERWVAVGALGRIGDAPARDALAGLLGGSDSLLHRNAVLALAQCRDPRAAPWLAAMLDRAHYDGDARLQGPDADLLDESSRLAVRDGVVEQFLVNACRAAGRLGDPGLVAPLRPLRESDPSLKVRSAAIRALDELGALSES